jgi:AraC-like DNA-binding protein
VTGRRGLEPRAKEPTGLARLALIHLDRTAQLGLSRPELLGAAGLTEEQLRDPDARIPLSALVRLWHAVTERVPDPTLGLLLGAPTRARELGLVGYTMLFSHTIGAALQRYARYSRIMADTLVVHLDATPEATWVRVDVQPALRAFRQAADARLAAMISVCRQLSGTRMAPLSVQFPYRSPDNVRPYEEFFRAPLEFGAMSTAFLIGADDLARPVVTSDEALTGYLEHLAEQTLSAVGAERTVHDQVRRVLWQELSEGVPDLKATAHALGLGARTLQRRLRAERTTFAGVLAGLRREMAPSLLRDGDLAVSEVAFLLGYEDVASFQRAFRQWFGVSPRAFRRLPVGSTPERRP